MIKVLEKDGIRYEYCEDEDGRVFGVMAGLIGSKTFGPLLGTPLEQFKVMLEKQKENLCNREISDFEVF